MKPLLLAGSLAVSCLGATALAAAPFSASVGYGVAKFEGGEVNAPYLAPYTLSDDTTYLRLTMACDFSKAFAVEASYYFFQNIDTEMADDGAPPPFPGFRPSSLLAWEVNTLALGPTFTWSPAERWTLRAGGAVTLTNSHMSLYGGRYGSDSEDSDGVVGVEGHITGDYQFSESFSAGLNISYISFGTEMGTSGDVTSLMGDVRLSLRW